MGTKLIVTSFTFGSIFIALSLTIIFYQTKLIDYLVTKVIKKKREFFEVLKI